MPVINSSAHHQIISKMNRSKRIIRAYLTGLETANTDLIIELFHPNGIVLSPLYGKQSAQTFYKDLFRDTNNSKITFLDDYYSDDGNKACVNFIYEWEMVNGQQVAFDCVDVFEFDQDHKITC